MKHLIIVAHPIEKSFTMSLARTYEAELRGLGHSVKAFDLYREKFDPALHANELSPENGDEPADNSDVANAQEDVRAADVLTVIYPLWWLSMPAMMKGYIDRVFARDFAYESRDGKVHGLLAGKQAVLITISGAPLPLLIESGNWNAVQVLQDTHIFRAAGFELLEHVHFDEVVPDLEPAVVEKHLERVRECAKQHFSAKSFASLKQSVSHR
jgi:NAD(P)H dehydrogenase (quinone)